MSTKDLHPGLGSGALREALERIEALSRWKFRGLAFVRLSEVLAALSLSSPIEPGPTHIATVVYRKGQEPIVERPTPQASSPQPGDDGLDVKTRLKLRAQASSEIREALALRNKLLDEGVQRMGSVLAEYSGPERENRPFLLMCQEWIDAAERALAPSRQGAGGK